MPGCSRTDAEIMVAAALNGHFSWLCPASLLAQIIPPAGTWSFLYDYEPCADQVLGALPCKTLKPLKRWLRRITGTRKVGAVPSRLSADFEDCLPGPVVNSRRGDPDSGHRLYEDPDTGAIHVVTDFDDAVLIWNVFPRLGAVRPTCEAYRAAYPDGDLIDDLAGGLPDCAAAAAWLQMNGGGLAINCGALRLFYEWPKHAQYLYGL